MLYAKINPPAGIIDKNALFSGVIKELDYMTATVRPYFIGGHKFTFEVSFGNVTYDAENNPRFVKVDSKQIIMTSNELSTWGTDDTVALELIATKLGTSVVEVIDIIQLTF